MSGPENTFIGSVHKHLPTELYRVKNNNLYHAGIADVWYSGMEQDFWIEYKFITIPKRAHTVLDFGLSELQRHWLLSRHDEGRNVGVIVGCTAGGAWFPGLAWNHSYTASEFSERIQSRKELALMVTGLVSP